MKILNRIRLSSSLVCISLLVGGCATQPKASEDAALQPLGLPRDRMGCLPFPGLFTLYTKADPAQLGQHHYGAADPDASSEVERGILYTKRAGFLDLAHLRNTIDWTRYCYDRFRTAVASGERAFALNGSNGSMFHVTLALPDDRLVAIPPAERAIVLNEACLRSAERLAYTMLTWHETASWYGDHTFVFDESPSAFTWDDVMSHVIGVRVAEMALRDRSLPFDRAVTFYLDAQLKYLGAVSPDETQAAVEAVDGLWWANGRPLKRQLDIGLDSGHVTPWLIPAASTRRTSSSVDFAVPTVGVIDGHDFSKFFKARIEPRCEAAVRMRLAVTGHPEQFSTDHDLPQIIASMRTEMVAAFGDRVGDPTAGPHAPAGPVHALLPADKLPTP